MVLYIHTHTHTHTHTYEDPIVDEHLIVNDIVLYINSDMNTMYICTFFPCIDPSLQPIHPPLSGNYRNDISRYSAATNTWTALAPSGNKPDGRVGHGFAATPDGMLYAFGGYIVGEEGGGFAYVVLRMYSLPLSPSLPPFLSRSFLSLSLSFLSLPPSLSFPQSLSSSLSLIYICIHLGMSVHVHVSAYIVLSRCAYICLSIQDVI
jgi:hypothetical protein